MKDAAEVSTGIFPFHDIDCRLDEGLLLFLQLIDESNDALFIVDPATGKLLYANQKAGDHLGYTRQELRALRIFDYAGNVPDLPAWLDLVRSLHQKRFVILETLQTRKDGSTVPVEANVKLVRVGDREFAVSVARDLTRRKAAENARIEEKQKQEALIAAMSDGVTMQDTNFRIIYQSELHQQKQGNHLGEFCYRAYRGLDRLCDGCLLVKAFADGKTHRRETMVTTADGPFYMEVVCTPLTDAQGTITAGIEVVHDITERKKIEQMKEDMLSSISHEMRTPLTAMIGFTEFLLANEVTEEQRVDFLQTTLKESERLRGMIDSLLLLQHLRSGKETAVATSMSVLVLCDEVSRPPLDLATSNHTLIVDCPKDFPLIEADEEKLLFALRKLLDNAFKYSPDGGTVVLRARLQNERVILSVEDEGVGIPKEEQERIFDRFYRIHEHTNRHVKGTGIGLALVREIATAHGGKAWVESQPGRGSTFYLSLPAHPSQAEGAHLEF